MYTVRVFQKLVDVVVFPDGDGFGAAVPALKGVVSHGDTAEEAFANIQEALLAVLEVHRDEGTKPPWTDPTRMVRPVCVPTDEEWPYEARWMHG